MTMLLQMLDRRCVRVKLSCPMRCTHDEYHYTTLTLIAQALVEHAPPRLIWVPIGRISK